MPDVENLVAMSDLFEVSLDYLLKEGQVCENKTEDPDLPQEFFRDPGTSPKDLWLLIPVVLPLMGLSLLLYGWLFEKDILIDIGFLLLGIALALLVVGILLVVVFSWVKKFKSKK